MLDNLSDDVEQFEQKGKVPVQLKTRLAKDKEKIEALVKKQKMLYWLLLVVVGSCFFYERC